MVAKTYMPFFGMPMNLQMFLFYFLNYRPIHIFFETSKRFAISLTKKNFLEVLQSKPWQQVAKVKIK
jgi:hypothetical protein